MGRLTLNVLLSFAQFEREVTGERIRDKIAASKRKEMLIGGRVPVGYNVKDQKLIIDTTEAEQVKGIFRLYLKLGCVAKLKARLDQNGVKSKERLSVATPRKTERDAQQESCLNLTKRRKIKTDRSLTVCPIQSVNVTDPMASNKDLPPTEIACQRRRQWLQRNLHAVP
jgi:DNA invertase Pin-like site-specific DNA recombinase